MSKIERASAPAAGRQSGGIGRGRKSCGRRAPGQRRSAACPGRSGTGSHPACSHQRLCTATSSCADRSTLLHNSVFRACWSDIVSKSPRTSYISLIKDLGVTTLIWLIDFYKQYPFISMTMMKILSWYVGFLHNWGNSFIDAEFTKNQACQVVKSSQNMCKRQLRYLEAAHAQLGGSW